MKRIVVFLAIMAAGAGPAAAQGFTIINDRGGSVERSRVASPGKVERSIDRTTANGRTVSRDVTLVRTGAGQATRTVVTTGPRGRQSIRSATITRN